LAFNSQMQRLRRVARAIAGKDALYYYDRNCVVAEFGAVGCAWTISPAHLCEASQVYSFGLGEDISFDLAVIERFGCTVHGFDPTPRSIQWVKSQRTPPQLKLHEYGLDKSDGVLRFHAPANPNFISHSAVHHQGTSNAVIELPVKCLDTILRELGTDKIDILKMDIEGSEYGVIPTVVENRARIGQLLIEFHHRFEGIGIRQTKHAVATLRQNGFQLFHVSPSGEELSFLGPGSPTK